MAREPDFLRARSWWWRPCCSRQFPVPPETRPIRVEPYAAASRLSYALWDTMPDAELFAAAQRANFDAARREKAARRMLGTPARPRIPE